MPIRKEKLSFKDLDPRLVELALEKEAQVRRSVSRGSAIANEAAAMARATTAQQLLRAGSDVLHTKELVDDTVRIQMKKEDRRTRKLLLPILWVMISLIFLPIILIMIATLGIPLPVQPVFGTILFVGMAFLPFLAVVMLVICQRREIPLAPDVLRATLLTIAKTQGERAYVGTAVEVWDAQATLGVAAARDVLSSLNSLLDSTRKLDVQEETIRRATNPEMLAATERERDNLQERLRNTQDTTARETLRQSLQLCEERLAQIQRLAPMWERIDAQQEVVRQVMSSVRTSLAGLRVASAGSEALPHATLGPHADALLVSATQLQNRARAVEQAVQEVAALSVR